MNTKKVNKESIHRSYAIPKPAIRGSKARRDLLPKGAGRIEAVDPSNSNRTKRLEVRLTEMEKNIFERASQISGHNTLSSFVVAAVRKYSDEVIVEHEKILRSEEDKKIFFNAILSNNEPNEKLKQAAEKYLNSKA